MTSEFITIIRPSFMRFCQDACRAAALNHLLFRIAGKSKNQPKEQIQAGEILWYATTEQITEEMSHAWGVCKLRQEINRLIHMGLIGRRVNPTWGVDRTKHFCFGTEQCEKFVQLCQEHAICVVHLGLPPEVMHLIYSSNANDKSIKCICSIHQMKLMEVSNASDESIEAIPIDRPTIDDYQDDNEEVSNAADALSRAELSQVGEIVKKRITNHRIQAISTEMVSAEMAEQAKQDIADAPTLELAAIPKQPITSVLPDSGDDAALVGPPAGDIPRASSGGSRASGVSTIPKRPRGKKPALPEPVPKFNLTEQQQHFWSLWCGVWFNQDIPPEMTETAYKHVVKLAPHITTAELMNSLIAYARKELQETQGIKRKAVQLGNCVNSYRGWKQVQREEPPKPEQEQDEDYSDPEGFDRFNGNGPEERDARLKLYAEMKAKGELLV